MCAARVERSRGFFRLDEAVTGSMWRCEVCREVGVITLPSIELCEVEHCLTGCNGRLIALAPTFPIYYRAWAECAHCHCVIEGFEYMRGAYDVRFRFNCHGQTEVVWADLSSIEVFVLHHHGSRYIMFTEVFSKTGQPPVICPTR